ncbi:MAG: transposase [Thermaerobacter sp.]|nr:transposase [Thermaerobacter sp.]
MSTIQRPGSQGTTWRLHAQWNLGTGQWEHVELTDAHGAESLTRLHLRPDDVVLADRNYANPTALAWIVDQHAEVIVRCGWDALRLQTLDGNPWSVLDAVRGLPDATPGEWWVQIPGTKDRPTLQVRIVAVRKSLHAAEQARRKARKDARDHGYPVAQETLEAADYVFILTTLPETAADAAEILKLYRLRWQIESAFKRLESLLHIDELRAFDPDLAQTYLLAKLLGTIMVDAIRTQGPDFSPYGFPVQTDIQRRLAYFPTDLAGSPHDRPGPGRSDGLAGPIADVDQSTP